MGASKFISGLDLNERFFFEIVQPILHHDYPQLRYAAARIGSGSEVLGFDTPMSADHDWGPHFQLFLTQDDWERVGEAIGEALRHKLPTSFLGHSTHYAKPSADESFLMTEKSSGPVNHRIHITTVRKFCWDYMAYDSNHPPTVTDWLTISQQILLGMTAGRVFVDNVGDLTAVRQTLSYFPDDVWYYLLACQWGRLGEETPFVGRTGDVGDELGSRLLASRLVHDIMQLCFLMERQYVPYPKWFGSGFQRLACAKEMTPHLTAVLQTNDWRSREAALCVVYEQVGHLHNALGITEPLDTSVQWFHDRPFRVPRSDAFAAAIHKKIQDEAVRAIKTGIGSIDQFSHSTNLRSYPHIRQPLRELYAQGSKQTER